MNTGNLGVLLLSGAAAVAVAGSALAAEPVTRSGTMPVSESRELLKIDGALQEVHSRVEYNWDDGLVYTYRHNAKGELLDVLTSTNALRPTDAELAAAFDLVWNDPEVRTIRSRQAGLEINGGFTYREPTGKCAAPARCVQVFLFDGENVVRHMLVDLRTGSIANRSYIPPRNQGATQ